MAIDLAYQFVHQEDRQGRSSYGVAVPPADFNDGTYHMYANMLGVSCRLMF
jgi:hypothetical protein